MADRIVWSKDDESFNSDSLGDLIRDYDLVVGDTVYTGIAYHPSPSMFIDADDVIEYAQERAYDEFSDYAENYLNSVTDEEKKKLDDFLADWMKRNSDITFYSVKNITKHIITAAEIEDAARAERIRNGV